MKPPKREFEQVEVDIWLNGVIKDIQYDPEHKFKGKGYENEGPATRFMLQLNDYKDTKPSRWLYFNYGENSNLYKKWIIPLVEGAYKNMDLDLDHLKGMKIKVMYSQNGEYQNLEMVRPLESKFILTSQELPKTETEPPSPPDEEVPF